MESLERVGTIFIISPLYYFLGYSPIYPITFQGYIYVNDSTFLIRILLDLFFLNYKFPCFLFVAVLIPQAIRYMRNNVFNNIYLSLCQKMAITIHEFYEK